MSDEGLTPFEEGSVACPFIAFEDDRDHRADRPDYRHRCFASSQPEPRALPHQERYCLAPGFPQCPVFLDWARQEAAAVNPAGRRSSAPASDEEAADKSGRPEREAPAFLAGRPRPNSSDEGTTQPTRRTPEPVGDLWGYKGDVKRPAADTTASSGSAASGSGGAADSAAILGGVAGLGSAGSALGSGSVAGASRGTPPITPPSSPMARPVGSHPAWERPPKLENFPRLHSRNERSSNSPLLLAMVGVAILVVFLFAWPFLTSQGGKTPVATHTPSPTATLASPTPSTAPTPTPPPSGSVTSYTVREGDTIYTISIQFGVTQAEIMAANPDITDPAYIQVGQKIKIPHPGASAVASPSSSAS
jgi:LysM repeat protein